MALNIKSDGLQELLKYKITQYALENYFIFDMSVPDALEYIKCGLNVFTRQSEYEQIPSFYAEAKGVWLDEFHGHWICLDVIEEHFSHHKQICIVSPDLHGRSYLQEWQEYKNWQAKFPNRHLMLCTDRVEEARRFFDGEN